jgi:hypothetical protein
MSVLKSLTLAAAVVVGVSSVASAQTGRQHVRQAPAAYSDSTSMNAYNGDSSNFGNFQDKWKVEY